MVELIQLVGVQGADSPLQSAGTASLSGFGAESQRKGLKI